MSAISRNHGRIPKKSTLGLRDWIKKKQPEMVSYGTLTSQATDTGHVSNTQVPVYGAQKSSNAAPSIPAPTRSGPASTQAVKVKVRLIVTFYCFLRNTFSVFVFRILLNQGMQCLLMRYLLKEEVAIQPDQIHLHLQQDPLLII